MKRYLILSIFFLISLVIFSQTQQGIVKTRGRMTATGTVIPGTRLSGATVNVRNVSALVTGNNGSFLFTIPSKTFYLTGVKKQGYMLCDNDILGRGYQYSANPFVVVMETPDNATADRLAAEQKIRRTLRRQVQEKEDEIEALKTQQKITEEEYSKKLQELYAAQSNNETLISEMAERYSTIDFDEMDDFQRQVAYFIQNGELTRADSLLNTKGSMDARSAELDRMDAAIKADSEDLAKRQEAHDRSVEMKAKALEDFATDCYSRFEICKMLHKNDSAAYWLELRASKDTTNIKWQVDLAIFVGEYIGNYDKELSLMQNAYNRSLALHGITDESIDCLSNISLCYKKMSKYELALEKANEVIQLRKSIHGDNDIDFPKDFSNIAAIYGDMREFDNALEYYNKSMNALINKKADKSGIVWCYNNIGYMLNEMGNYEQALEYLGKASELQLEISGNRHPDFAITLTNIGGYYYNQQKFDEAKKCFEESLSIFQENYSEEHPMIGTCYHNLASIYLKENYTQKSLSYTKKALDILQSVYGTYHVQVATLYGNRSAIYEKIGDYDQALKDAFEASKIFKQLYGTDSQASIHYAVHQIVVARLYEHKNELSLAEHYYRTAIQIEESIYSSPNKYLFSAYNQLAWFYYNHKAFIPASEAFEKCEEIAISVYGVESANSKTSMGGVYNSLLTEYTNAQSKETLDKFHDFMSTHVLTSSVTSPDSPAGQQGMDGEYIILQIEDWTPDIPVSFISKLTELKGNPKTIVTLKNGIIESHRFEDAIGMMIDYKRVTKEDKAKMLNLFLKSKKKQESINP